jgi:ABC-type glutathione transport system ATPase component
LKILTWVAVDDSSPQRAGVRDLKRQGVRGEDRLDGVDLSIGEGEIFALLRPNGAGKTTTVKILSTPDPGGRRHSQLYGARSARRGRIREQLRRRFESHLEAGFARSGLAPTSSSCAGLE